MRPRGEGGGISLRKALRHRRKRHVACSAHVSRRDDERDISGLEESLGHDHPRSAGLHGAMSMLTANCFSTASSRRRRQYPFSWILATMGWTSGRSEHLRTRRPLLTGTLRLFVALEHIGRGAPHKVGRSHPQRLPQHVRADPAGRLLLYVRNVATVSLSSGSMIVW